MNILDRVQWRVTKVMKGWSISCEERVRAGTVQPREEKAQRVDLLKHIIPKGRAHRGCMQALFIGAQ